MKPLLPRALALFVLLPCLLGAPAPVYAEKADRSKPLVIEADRDFVRDERRQVLVYNGNAVLSQGTMLLRAERIELRETPDGYRSASAVGTTARPASWREKRDGGDEWVEAVADRIDYDGKADTLRFEGRTQWRRLRGGAPVEEINGRVLVWDNVAGVLTVEAGGAPTPANPSSRIRAVLQPKTAAPAPAASAGAQGLAPVRSLEGTR